ncbi:GNAT family N-acetyltransferase [Rheinheimera sediminis]|uniref:bifunctional GNAT family N-acetyltransferase/hotdog fold thioesterase n=1 Tax=Rheinheimera sp. YQF-1 TaxID=2499626 RepID=UPI000FD82732|nr:bifunctional GNAT family N-acetyltransferase/hotdog fold thioesterase [Rheinheimera sp. YQF-1]RVT47940.1 GNAT family N-acetyltransferase [Rheinheimera sp. YQF-1]
MNWQLSAPQTEAQWLAYYQLRWLILRAPWAQPKGSEQDELEAESFHRMVCTEDGEVVAVGRLHKVDEQTAQVRYMAVSDQWQGHGLGAMVLHQLEQVALELGMQRIILNARDTASGFYQKVGYSYLEPANSLFGIAHHRYVKTVSFSASTDLLQRWQSELQRTFWQKIPLSASMQLLVQSVDTHKICCSIPLEPNINLHQTMFAGSIYTLGTLTAWGMVWLLLKDQQLDGDIVLADAHIRYLKPVTDQAEGRCWRHQCQSDFSALGQQRKARLDIKVGIFCDDIQVAVFEGRFAVLPKK